MKMPKILFFIEGMAPTPDEQAAALEIGIVAMRNRSAIYPDTNPELCDAVAGENIPEQYANKPVVKTLGQAINILKEKQKVENAAAAAALTSPTPFVGKKRTGTEETPLSPLAKTNWKANA